jgi:hypothetical protein
MAARDIRLEWRKSSRCGESAACVEVAFTAEHVLVRMADQPDGPVLSLSHSTWSELVAGIRAGQFDR